MVGRLLCHNIGTEPMKQGGHILEMFIAEIDQRLALHIFNGKRRGRDKTEQKEAQCRIA